LKTCIIHIGTHKTGTTSLQIFVEQNRAALQQAGLALPRAGRPAMSPTGNHQFGWDLLVRGSSDDLPRLTQELRESPVDAALLTSEDLCLLYARSKTLEMMAEAISAAGYVPKIAVYLRPQAAYAESMYVERIKHDYVRPLRSYLDQILQTGRYVPDGSPIQIEFRYTRLLEPFVRVFGRENVFVRAYEPGRGTEHIFRDFLGLLASAAPGFGNSPLQLSVSHPRANESLSFGQLLDTTYAKLLPAGLAALEPRTLLRTHLPTFSQELLATRFALLSRDETLQLLHEFAPENEAVARDFGAIVPFRSQNDVAAANDPGWERAAAERAIFDRLLQVWMDARERAGSKK
jgi:hypothetical protein